MKNPTNFCAGVSAPCRVEVPPIGPGTNEGQTMGEKITTDPVATYAAVLSTAIAVIAGVRAIIQRERPDRAFCNRAMRCAIAGHLVRAMTSRGIT